MTPCDYCIVHVPRDTPQDYSTDRTNKLHELTNEESTLKGMGEKGWVLCAVGPETTHGTKYYFVKEKEVVL